MKKIILTFAIVLLSSMMLVSCFEPEADIDYTLTCSSDLLEYVTPQITYSSNGNTITYNITDEEWSDVNSNDESIKTSIVINGDTITRERVLKKWTKHVHYDDFSIIDDEMVVTYIPKSGIQSDQVRLLNHYHNLSAKLDFTDEDNNQYLILPSINLSLDLSGPALSDIVIRGKDHAGYHVESNGKYNEL